MGPCRLLACGALLALGSLAGAADGGDRYAKLADQLAHGTPYQRSQAAQLLQRDGGAAAGAADSVLATANAAIDAREWPSATLALDTLAAIKPAALGGCVPGLQRALGGGIADVRREAARASTSLGAAGAPLAPLLAGMVKDRVAMAEALHALAAIGTAAEVAVPTLIGVAQDQDVGTALAGIEALEQLGPRAREVVPALCGLLARPELRVRALEALDSFGHAAADAVPQVVEAERAAAGDQRQLFVRTLQQIETADIPPVARDAKGSCREGGSVEIELPIDDPDDLSPHAVVAKAAHGIAIVHDGTRLTYRAAWGFVGDDVVAWHGNDDRADGKPAQVTVTIEPDAAAAAPIHFIIPAKQAEKLRVTFDKPLDQASAETAANFGIDQSVKVRTARLLDDLVTVELATSGVQPDHGYELAVHHLADRAAAPVTTEADHVAFKASSFVPGLTLETFANTDLQGAPESRSVVTSLAFAQGPVPGRENYSVRLTGQVEPAASETYTFYARSDDGIRLWIDGKPVIDGWRSQSATDYSGTIDLVAHRLCDIRIEYYEGGGPQELTLWWSSPSTPKQVVPASALLTLP